MNITWIVIWASKVVWDLIAATAKSQRNNPTLTTGKAGMKLCVMDERSRAAYFGPCGEEILGRAGEESEGETQKKLTKPCILGNVGHLGKNSPSVLKSAKYRQKMHDFHFPLIVLYYCYMTTVVCTAEHGNCGVFAQRPRDGPHISTRCES